MQEVDRNVQMRMWRDADMTKQCKFITEVKKDYRFMCKFYEDLIIFFI